MMAREMIPATPLVSRPDLIGCYADQYEEESGPSPLNTGTMARGMNPATPLEVFVSRSHLTGCSADQ